MKRLLKLGAALAALALAFAACPQPTSSGGGGSKVDPVVTGIKLQYQIGTGTVTDQDSHTFSPGDVVTFQAVVSGTDGANPTVSIRNYTMTVTPVSPPTGLFTVTDVTGGAKRVTLSSTFTGTGSFRVTATSTVDSTKTVSWTVAVSDTTAPTVLSIALKTGAAQDTATELTSSQIANGGALDKGGEASFWAEVNAINNASTAYTITVTDAASAATVTDAAGGGKKIVIKNDAAYGSTVTVTATSTADAAKTVSYTITVADLTQPLVLGIQLLADGEQSLPVTLGRGDEATFTASVNVSNNASTAYTITVTDAASAATVTDAAGGGKKIVIKDDAADGSVITVTATSSGNGVSGSPLTDTHDVTVYVSGGGGYEPPNFANAQWRLVNTALGRGVILNASTTKNVPAADADGRYVIFNNEPGALIDAAPPSATTNPTPVVAPGSPGNGAFKDVTIMYLDTPVTSDPDDWKAFGIEARVRISGLRDSEHIYGTMPGEPQASVRQGVVVGFICEDPADIGMKVQFDANGLVTNGNDAPAFIGQRVAANGQHRGYATRFTGVNSGVVEYGSQTMTPPGSAPSSVTIPGVGAYNSLLNTYDWLAYTQEQNITLPAGATKKAPAKQEGFASQEYIYKVMHPTVNTYYVYVYDTYGTYLFEYNFTGTNLNNLDRMVDGSPVYLSFLVYGVEAEISGVKVYYGGDDPVWEDPATAGAQPKDAEAGIVCVTTDTPALLGGDTESDYSCNTADFPAFLSLAAEVVPVTMIDRDVLWSVSGDDILEVDEDGVVTVKPGISGGKATVTATPAAGGVVGTYKLWLLDPTDVAPAESVTINAPALTTLNYGDYSKDQVQLSVTITPANALKGVTWAVTGGAATVDAATGLVKAAKLSSDGSVTVTATTTDGSNLTSAPVTINVKADTMYRNWTFGAGRIPNWKGQDANAEDSTAELMEGGLTVNPLAAGIGRWNPTRVPGSAALASLYTGCFQPSGAGTFGSIDLASIGLGSTEVKITIVWTHTGDSNTADVRKLWVQFGDAVPIENTITSSDNWNNGGNPGWVVDNAYFINTGTANTVTFGANATMRIYAVIVEPQEGGPVMPAAPQIWYSAVGSQAGITTPFTLSVDGKTLYLSGTGSINSSGQEFGFVYLKVPDEDFTMVVKINDATWGSANNAARLGIVAIPQAVGTITQSATGVLANVPTNLTLPLGGSVVRGDNTWVRMQTVGQPFGTAGTSGTSNINTTSFPAGTAPNGQYIRLRRVGSDIFAGASLDGVTFVDAGSTAPQVGAGYVGLCACGNGSNIATGEFTDLRFASGTGKGAATLTIAELDPVDFAWLEE